MKEIVYCVEMFGVAVVGVQGVVIVRQQRGILRFFVAGRVKVFDLVAPRLHWFLGWFMRANQRLGLACVTLWTQLMSCELGWK